MKSYPHILKAAAEVPWAMDRRKLDQIAAFLSLKAQGLDVPEDVRAEIAADRRAAAQPSAARGVAVIPVFGSISYRANLFDEFSGGTSIQQLTAAFRQAVNDSEVGTIVLQIDSPGGVVSGVPELADEIFAARGQKKIIAVADTMAASAAYWLMSAATEAVVSPSGGVGSVGVYALHVDQSVAMEMAGLKATFISAGPHKTEGNSFKPLGDKALAAIQADIDTFYDMFLKAAAKGRGVSLAEVKANFGGGRMLLAKKAKAAGMVDRIDTLANVLSKLGVDVGTLSAKRVEHDGSYPGADAETRADPEAIVISKKDDGRVFVQHDWPAVMTVCNAFIAMPESTPTIDADELTIAVANGVATYRMVEMDAHDNWRCELVSSEYTSEGELALQDAGDQVDNTKRRRRLAMLRHS